MGLNMQRSIYLTNINWQQGHKMTESLKIFWRENRSLQIRALTYRLPWSVLWYYYDKDVTQWTTDTLSRRISGTTDMANQFSLLTWCRLLLFVLFYDIHLLTDAVWMEPEHNPVIVLSVHVLLPRLLQVFPLYSFYFLWYLPLTDVMLPMMLPEPTPILWA